MPLLRRTLGEKRAGDLVLSGRVINAEEAGNIGLVSRVLPAASYDADVEAMIAGLSGSSATSLALTKWLLYKLDSMSFEDGIAAGIVTDVEARATEDFRAALRRRGSGLADAG
jgi:enoyl-CoA hydratase/carnithine racemase